MIYESIKSAVEFVPDLAGNVFPSGACVDDVEPPFAIYNFADQTVVADLSGNVHHYADTILIYIYASTYDQAHSLYRAVQDQLLALASSANGHGQWIFGVQCGADKEDGIDFDLDLMARALKATVQWCDI